MCIKHAAKLQCDKKTALSFDNLLDGPNHVQLVIGLLGNSMIGGLWQELGQLFGVVVWLCKVLAGSG